jgi:ring-1,2-phenylacetyl-CoA epoxidase subunit PaaA
MKQPRWLPEARISAAWATQQGDGAQLEISNFLFVIMKIAQSPTNEKNNKAPPKSLRKSHLISGTSLAPLSFEKAYARNRRGEMFTDKIELKDFDKMDPEYKDLLGRVLTIQADCEIGGPHLYVQKMLPAAPTKLDQLIVARTAAEEIDHFRKVARVAGDIGVDVSFVLSQPNEKRFVDAFRGLITTWEDNAVFGFLIDRVGRYQLEEFYDCSYLPLQRILPDIVTEELGHIEYGYNKTVELLSKGDKQKERVQKAIDYWYIRALDMFGRSGSKRAERYRYWGLKRRANEQAREDYIREVNPILEKMGLKVPDPLTGRHYI